MPIAKLDRAVLKLTGDTVRPWLESLITNSIQPNITFAALLTPQGKIIADFFITQNDQELILDTPRKFAPNLLKRLKMYTLREKIDINDISETHFIYAFWDGDGEVGHIDPRHSRLGYRLISEDVLEANADYHTHRLGLGIPDSSTDFETISAFPADACMDLLNGVDYKKGCFIGQEVVSRMHRKTNVRKRMCGFSSLGTAKPGDTIRINDKSVATVLYFQNARGMALVRLDKRTGTPLLNNHVITIMDPSNEHENKHKA